MKKFIASILALSLTVAQACWFTVDNFNNNYIAGVNNYLAHYSKVDNLSDAVYHNGISVALPITVFVKVGPRFPDQPGESAGPKPITKAVLQYKILPNGSWVTVKTIQNVSWTMDWSNPVALFGKNNIDPTGIAAYTEIMIRVYFTDGIYETGDLDTDITSTVPGIATKASGGTYEGGWTAPFVFRVIWNGKRRAK